MGRKSFVFFPYKICPSSSSGQQQQCVVRVPKFITITMPPLTPRRRRLPSASSDQDLAQVLAGSGRLLQKQVECSTQLKVGKLWWWLDSWEWSGAGKSWWNINGEISIIRFLVVILKFYGIRRFPETVVTLSSKIHLIPIPLVINNFPRIIPDGRQPITNACSEFQSAQGEGYIAVWTCGQKTAHQLNLPLCRCQHTSCHNSISIMHY